MRRTLEYFLLLALGLLLCSCEKSITIDGFIGIAPKEGKGVLEVLAELPWGVDEPLEGAQIEALDEKDTVILEGRSAADGYFLLVQNVDAQAGLYHVRVSHEGFETLRTKVRLTINQNTHCLIHLIREPE